MAAEEKLLTEKESLELISQMINKAKNSYHDSGIGPILWGSVIALCSLVTFIQLHFNFRLPFDIWLLTLIAIVPQIFIISKEKKKNKVRSYDDITMDYVWTSFGIGIFILIFINASIVNHLNPVFQTYIEVKGSKPEFNYSSFSTSFFLLLYGFPTIITGGCMKMKPMLFGGVICWVAAVVAVYTSIEWDMLLTALAAISAWLIPGILMYRRNKKRLANNV